MTRVRGTLWRALGYLLVVAGLLPGTRIATGDSKSYGTCAGGSGCCAGYPEAPCGGVLASSSACLLPSSGISLAVARTVDSKDGKCARSSLPRPIHWTDSGAWIGSDLILADTVGRTLRRFSVEGKLQEEAFGALSGSWRDLYPLRVQEGGDRLLIVQIEGNRFVILDSQFRFRYQVDALALAGPGGARLENIYDWAATGDDIVAFADLRDGTGRWSTAIVHFSLNSPSGFNILVEFSKLQQVASRKYYRMGHSYLAVIGKTAYAILMEDGVRLYRSAMDQQDKMKEMTALAPQAAPILPSFVFPGDYAPMMRAVEQSTMPTGLYAWKGSLYILSRHPVGVATRWMLTKIDPQQNQVKGTVEIPSHANHLLAVPGVERWAFVEKGPALGLRDEKVSSILSLGVEDVAAAFNTAAGQPASLQEKYSICR
jgi:hypothetical protein